MTIASFAQNHPSSRIDWVDAGKGICIVLVVLMHANNGVERILGELTWLNGFIAWARPFRMPDFFLISGLFLAARINRPWRAYLDTKVVHFAYFYILWMTIIFILKSAATSESGTIHHYLLAFIDPPGSLWFIYMLAVFFVVTKLIQPISWKYVWLAAAALHSLDIHTGWTLVDEFAGRFIYFYSGFIAAPFVFQFAAIMDKTKGASLFAGLTIWAVINAWLVQTGLAVKPGISLILGFAGAGAVITLAVILSRVSWAHIISYCGKHSLVIYLGYAVFLASSRLIVVYLCESCDGGFITLVITSIAIAGPMTLFWIVRDTPLAFLFVRPDWAKMNTSRRDDQKAMKVQGM